MKQLIVPTLIVAFLAGSVPTAQAEKWYHSGWVIGSAGLLVGGLVGYELGRQDRPSRRVYVVESPEYSRVYSQPYYAEETRVWPFYRRTKVYPLASVRAYYDRANNALPPGYDGVTPHPAKEGDDARSTASAPSINIGDNNQNVTITIDQQGPAGSGRLETRPILNYKVDPKAGRLSERLVDTAVPAAEPESSESRSVAPAEEASSTTTEEQPKQ